MNKSRTLRTGRTIFTCLFFLFAAEGIFAQQTLSINEAVALTAEEIGLQLRGSNIAVVSFSSNWRTLSFYIVNELENALHRGGSVTVVDRQRLDYARQELNFQMSWEVNERTARDAGRFAGAHDVLTGEFIRLARNIYQFRAIVLCVEEGVRKYSNSLTIRGDTLLGQLTPRAEEREARVRARAEEREARARARAMARRSIAYMAYRNNVVFILGGYYKWEDRISGVGHIPLEVRFSPVPFTVLGAGTRFGILGADGYLSGTLELGFVYPLIRDNLMQENVMTIFANGLFEIGYFGGMHGVLGRNVTVGFDAGISILRWVEIRYRGTFYQNNFFHSIGLSVVIPLSPIW